jgi:hypothetical protein
MASKANGDGGGQVPWRLIGWAIPVALLTVPLLNRWPWTISDFIVAGAMFAIVGGSFELAVRASGNLAYRLGAATALATAFLLTWINLAVGIIGNENDPLNLMFFAVIAAALAGSLAARFRAGGIAIAMTVAAAIQASIGMAAFALGWGASEPPGALGLFVLIEGFAGLWLLSAWLFRKAAKATGGAG